MTEKVENAETKLAGILESKLAEANGKIAALAQERDAEKAKAAGIEATAAELRTRLKSAEDRAVAAESGLKAARVEAALVGLPEGVAKALRDATSKLDAESALGVIEATKAIQPNTPAPGAPRSEARPPTPAKGRTEQISDEAMLSAMA